MSKDTVKGAASTMNRQPSSIVRLGFVAAIGIWAGLIWAAPQLTSIEFPQGQGEKESVTLKLTAPPSDVTNVDLPKVHQGVVVLHKTELGMTQTAWPSPGKRLKFLTLRSLQTPSGDPSVQVTLDMAPGFQSLVHAKDKEVFIDLVAAAPSTSASTASTSSEDPIQITNADLDGATPGANSGDSKVSMGQDATQSPAVMQGFQYYTPEAVPKTRPVTEEEREELLSQKIFQKRVSLDFKDAELQNVIRLLAAKTNLNLILSRDQVRGNVTLKLTNVRLGVALDSILKTNQLSYVVEPGGIVRIVPLSEVRTEKVETRTEYIPINWVKAANVVKTLEPFKSVSGMLKADEESNGVIITDVPARVEQISKLIERIDLPEKQVMIEARLVDITVEAQRNMGIDWTLKRVTGYTAAKQPIYGDTIDLSEGSGGRNTIGTVGNSVNAFGSNYNLDATLDFYERRSEATVLANPKIGTLNNIMAKIDIKRMVPYISAQQTGQNQIGTVEFKETGVILEVTPNVTNNGYVRMTLKPEQKVRKGDFTSSQGPIPIVDERKVESNVIVKDEESIVLGGLRQVDNSISESGAPFLLSVPVIGWFFKQQSTSHTKTELVLFVTPHIVKDPTLTANELQQYEQIEYNWDLPDYYYAQTRLRDSAPSTQPKEK